MGICDDPGWIRVIRRYSRSKLRMCTLFATDDDIRLVNCEVSMSVRGQIVARMVFISCVAAIAWSWVGSELSRGGESGARIPPGPVVVKLLSAADKKPVASAAVNIGGRYSTSGADGQAVFDGIPAGRYRLLIEHYGFDRIERSIDLPAGRRQPIDLTLSPVVLTKVAAQAVTRPDDRPIAGAHLAFVADNVPALTHGRIDCRTDWEGNVTILEMPVGRYQAEITAAGCVPVRTQVNITKDIKPLRFELVRVTEPVALTITAVDGISGQPLSGAKVIIAEGWPKGILAEAAADTQGKVVFKDIRVTQLNWMDKDGRVAASRRRVQVRAEATGHEPAFAVLSLDANAAATLKLNPTAPIEEREPNDSLSTAQVVHTGSPVQLTIGKAGDKDFFRFRLDYPAAVRAEVGPKPPIPTHMRLYSVDGKRIVESMAYQNAPCAVAANVPAGEYLMSVGHWGDNAASNEKFTLSITATRVPDSMEPNDGPDSARLIQSGEEVRGYKFPVGDNDCFRFRVNRPGWARITLQPHALEHLVRVLDAAGSKLGESVAYANAPLALVAPVRPGWNTIQVAEWGDNACSTEPYTMRFELIEDDGVDDPAPAPKRIAAVRTARMPGLIANTINPIGDTDTYALALPSAGVVWARSISPIESHIQVLSSDGTLLTQAVSYANAPAVVSWHSPGPRTVYMRIREWGDNASSNSPYLLTTWFEPCDELEAMGRNDRPEAAIPVDWGDVLRGSIDPVGDVDCYRVLVDHAGYMNIKGIAPTEILIRVFNAKNQKLVETVQYAKAPVNMHFPVLPGEHLIEVREWGDNAHSVQPYAYKVWLDRADPREKATLRDDPARPLKLGQAVPLVIEHIGDRDRFVFDAPAAGKYTVRTWAPVEVLVRVFDDRTGQKLAEVAQYANAPANINLEAKGATRYLVEVTEWGDNGASEQLGFILAADAGTDLCGAVLKTEVDPLSPLDATFWLDPIKPIGAITSASVDADGDGRADFNLTPGAKKLWRFQREGLYAASVAMTGAKSTAATAGAWVEAIGPRERKGVHLLVVSPGQDRIERDEACRVNAISYTGARISGVSLAVDGRPLAIARTAPYELEVPWRALAPGKHKLTFTAIDARGESAQVDRTVELSDYFDLQPQDGATISGNQVRVGWHSSAFGQAKVRYRAQGMDKWTEAIGDNGRQRVVMLPDLEAGRVYEFQPFGGRGGDGPVRTLTRVKGLAFGKAKYAGTVARDYDQRIGVSVRNQSEKPMVVRLECGKPPEESKLLVGFVGEGSEGTPFTLKPGEEREFMLGLSAQDCIHPAIHFPIRLASDSGYGDEADVEVNVKLPNVKLEWEAAGDQPEGLGKVLRLHNRGDGLTDLRIASSDPDLHVSPTIEHGVLPAGSSLEIVATPRLYEEFQKIEASLTAGAVGKTVQTSVTIAVPDGKKVFGTHLIGGASSKGGSSIEQDILVARTMAGAYLNPASVDWSKRVDGQDTDADGRLDRWTIDDKFEDILWSGDDTDGDGEVDFVHADIGYDGQYDYSAFKTKDGWEPTNLVEAFVEMGFKLPWARSAYEKHDVDFVMGDKVIGTLRDAIPEGNYTFKLPPSALSFTEAGTPGNNDIEIRSKHLRGGHYVVSSDFAMKVRMTGSHAFTVADSKEAAAKAVRQIKGLSADGPDFSVSSAEMQLEGEMRKGADIAVIVPVRNVGATRTHDVTVALARSEPGGKSIELARVRLADVPLIGSMPARLPWKAAPGRHSLRVVVDPDNECGDQTRDNNEAIVTFVIPGDDARPTLKVTEPADSSTLKDTIVPIRVEAQDDSGVARVELRIDSSLFTEMQATEPGVFIDRCILQPGAHALTARVTDSSGNQVEQTVKVTVDAKAPGVRILQPAEGTTLPDRATEVVIEADQDVAAAAVRVNGGPWQRVKLNNGQGTATVEAGFGAGSIEAMAASARGARGTAKVNVTCTKPRTEEQDQAGRPAAGTPAGANDAPQAPAGHAGAAIPDAARQPPGAAAASEHAAVSLEDGSTFDPFGPANAPVTPPGGRNKPAQGAAPAAETGDEAAAPGTRGGAPTSDSAGSDDAGNPVATDAGDGMEYGAAPATNLQPDVLPPVLPDRPDTPQAPEVPAAQQNASPAMASAAPSRPTRPAGGFVQAQSRASDWYCTNRPNIKVKFRLPEWLRRKNLSYASKEEYDRMVKKFIDDMKRRGVDTGSLERFQDALRKRIRRIEQPGELPGWLESFGLAKPKTDNPEELRKWREQMERAADAWYLKLLASGDPQLVAEGLKARAEAIGQFDKAMQEHAEATIQTIQANQKLVEDCVETLPVVGDITDLYAAATGETLLTGERISALERMIRLAGVLGPAGLEQLVKRSPNAQLVLQGLGEMGEAMGKRGKEMLANALGKPVKEIDNFMDAAARFANKEIRLGRDELAEKAEKAAKDFAKTPEGMADAIRRTKENAQAKELIENLQKHPPGSDEFKKAVNELQANKTAQALINDPKIRNELRDKVNQQIKAVHNTADAGTKADLDKFIKSNLPDDELKKMARDMGMDPDAALKSRQKIRETVERSGKKLDDVEVDVMTVTNQRPGSKSTSVGRDRDVTYVIKEKDVDITYPGTGEKVKKPGKTIADVDHTISEGPYNKNFHAATNDGKLPLKPDGSIDHAAIKQHADALDQTVTSKWHPEAYNTGEVQLKDFLDKGKTPTLTRIEDVKDTVTFKSDHWFHKAKEAAKDPVMAARHTAEGMRQATKQWDDLIMSRAKQYGLKPSNVPPRLQTSMDIFRKVKDGAISPAQAESMLKALGSSKEQAVREMAGFLEGMEKTVGAGWRKVKTAELVNDLHRLPGKGSQQWTESALQKINSALSRGEISGPNFLRLRNDAINGVLSLPKTPTWKQDLAKWADNALRRRLISESEKAMLDKATQ